MTYDVIIVGGGPVGVIAAHLLGHRGITTLVLERDVEPYILPRAVHFDHEILRILQSVGLADSLADQMTMPIGSMHFGADRDVIRKFRRIIKTDRQGWGSDYFFYQPDLEKALRGALLDRAAVELRLGHNVVEFDQDAAGVAVVSEGPAGRETHHGRYLLACDGGRSTVRKKIGVELEDLGFDEPWIVVDAWVDAPITLPDLHGTPEGVDMQRVMFIIGDPARPTSVIPGIGRHRRWEFMLMPHEAPEDFDDPAAVRALLATWLPDQPYEMIRRAVYRFHALLAESWHDRRVFLLGDAAHQTPPFFGQGLCHGIRDAANLGWKLQMVLNGVASPDLLSTYEAERKPQVRAIIGRSVKTGRYICTIDPVAAKQRDIEMREQVRRTADEYLDIIPALGAGVLATAQGNDAALGARFIQPPVINSTGCKALLDTFTGPGFVLLTRNPSLLTALETGRYSDGTDSVRFFFIASERAPELGPTTLLDCTGELLKWFDHYRCDAVMVRPDFYVFGTATTVEQVDDLIVVLRGALGHPAASDEVPKRELIPTCPRHARPSRASAYPNPESSIA